MLFPKKRIPEKMQKQIDKWDARVLKVAKGCQRGWGTGFPVISITLLKPFLRELIDIVREGE